MSSVLGRVVSQIENRAFGEKMIASLKGTLAYKCPQYAVVDVHGVGYRVATPLSSFYQLPEVEKPVALFTHTYVREDAIQLYGFLTREEYDVFLLLLTINGVGPRLALNILSGLPVQDFRLAIESGDVGKLGSIPGVGKKTAARLGLELKGKIGEIRTPFDFPVFRDQAEKPETRLFEDALTGLTYLGYSKSQARGAIDQILKKNDRSLTVESLIRDALKVLAQG